MADRAEKMDETAIRALLDYDPDTGLFRWRVRPLEYFADERSCNSWNAKHAGGLAGHIDSTGYYQITLLGVGYRSSRLAWCHVHGEWPANEVDHINGRRDDNRLLNLRDVPRLENTHNKRVYSNNTSGAAGVEFYRATQRWRATIRVGGKRRSLGHFADKAEAIAARKKAEADHGFHKNHGRAA